MQACHENRKELQHILDPSLLASVSMSGVRLLWNLHICMCSGLLNQTSESINVCVCLSEKVVFLGMCEASVFDFKARQMKPKTQEKLTKHTDPRWLMGWEK